MNRTRPQTIQAIQGKKAILESWQQAGKDPDLSYLTSLSTRIEKLRQSPKFRKHKPLPK